MARLRTLAPIGPDSWIKIGAKTVNVIGEVYPKKRYDDKLYKERKGYVMADEYGIEHVWICHKEKPITSQMELNYPCFWESESGKIEFSNPYDDLLNQAEVQNIIVRSMDQIIQHSNDPDDGVNGRIMAYIRNGAALTLPLFRKADDFLKLIVKAVLRKKLISLTGMPTSSAAQPHLFANMRSALLNTTKMSTAYCKQWMEIAGFDLVIYATDNGSDPDHPMNCTIKYDSRRDMISYIYPDGREEDEDRLIHLHNINEDEEPDDVSETIEAGEEEEW